MDTAIIVALITGACAVVGNVVVSAQTTKDLFAKLDKRSDLADQKLEGEMTTFRAEVNGSLQVMRTEIAELRKNVEKHNGVIERTFRLEERVSNLEHKE